MKTRTMKDKLAIICSDIGNSSILLYIISKGTEDYDMACALDFVAEAIERKADEFSDLLDEIIEEDDGTMSIRSAEKETFPEQVKKGEV